MFTNKKLIVISGATASGKTDLAIQTAQHFNTEIISADSRQCYIPLNIGVAKPTLNQLQAVKHYGIHFLELTEEFNAGKFVEMATQALSEIYAKSDYAVVCGGTGFYIQALVDGLHSLPLRDSVLRKELQSILEKQGIEALQNILLSKDPIRFKTIDIANPNRLIRAIEIATQSNENFAMLTNKKAEIFDFTVFHFDLIWEREILYNRINQRVLEMIEMGLEKEVKSLLDYTHLESMNTVGYKEWLPYFNNTQNLQQTIELIQQHTRNYAKRQLTWNRKLKNIIVLNAENPHSLEKIIETVSN